jgi:predicted CXXCH cytochrome family protein
VPRVATLLLLIAAACAREEPAPDAHRSTAPPSADSNIAARDYVGPAACGECHPDEHARWQGSLHAAMNARADAPGAVIGDFADAHLDYRGGTARFTTEGGARYLTTGTTAADRRVTRYRVTRTIGRRGLQEYVGIEDGHTDEVRLPFGWWPKRGGWFPQVYFDPWIGDETKFDAYAPVREPWAERCPWCHSTYPFEQRIARSSGPRALGHGLEQYFTSAAGGERLGAQVTTGISCESCHLGGRAHAAGAPIQFVPIGAAAKPDAPAPTSFAQERTDARVVNTVCAQCHSGPSPRLADGTALRNSSEALDLAASECHGARCTQCHDPHQPSQPIAQLEARSIAACESCHPAQRDATHAGGHTTATCLDCHMPRTVMGIDRFVRTHRISSPSSAAQLAAANACNLCHLDRSIAWTTDELRARWDASPPVIADDDRGAGETWLAGSASLRLLAGAAYARTPIATVRGGALPQLLDGFADPLPYMRAWSLFALEDWLGRSIPPSELDPRASPGVRAVQVDAFRRAAFRRKSQSPR